MKNEGIEARKEIGSGGDGEMGRTEYAKENKAI